MSAAQLLGRLRGHGLTLAVAESLTGGQVAAALVDVPGASLVLRGAVVAYATEVKHTVLGVDAALLAAQGPVNRAVALQMAVGAATLLGADVGLATTGVAGPGPADGYPAGTVHIAAVVTHSGRVIERCDKYLFSGDRQGVRDQTARAALALCGRALDDWEQEATEERWGK